MGDKVRQVGSAMLGWTAFWGVGDPYIEVYPLAAVSGREDEAREAFSRGESYPGSLHAINTSGDLAADGMPKDGRTPDQYVRDELTAWYKADGKDFEQAMDEGYGR